MTVKQIMTELESKGSYSIKKILLNHGVKEPFFGVKVEYLKEIQKKIKKDYLLSKELYATGNADAMYLAGLIADDDKMTVSDLQSWVKKAQSQNISEYTVPWVAVEGKHGYALAMEWIESNEEHIAAAGWATLAGLVAFKDDSDLDMISLKTLLDRVVKDISRTDNRVRHSMNAFVIALGVYVKSMTEEALSAAKKIGTLSNIPNAKEYILKIKEKGKLGKKKKTVKC